MINPPFNYYKIQWNQIHLIWNTLITKSCILGTSTFNQLNTCLLDLLACDHRTHNTQIVSSYKLVQMPVHTLMESNCCDHILIHTLK